MPQKEAKGAVMAEPNNSIKLPDPFEAWRTLRNAGMEAWAKTMTEAVNSDEYARTSGALMNSCLTASIPLKEVLDKAISQALQQMSIPTRADFISLADRLTQIEMRLDDMDAIFEEFAKRPLMAPVAFEPEAAAEPEEITKAEPFEVSETAADSTAVVKPAVPDSASSKGPGARAKRKEKKQ